MNAEIMTVQVLKDCFQSDVETVDEVGERCIIRPLLGIEQ